MTHEDEEDDLPCYRHPGELTALRCVSCERPICTECAIAAPVGIKCPDCARQNRAALGKIPRDKLIRGAVAAGAISAGAGFLFLYLRTGFFSLIIAYVMGIGIGELTRRAAGGFRDPQLARLTAIAAVIGMLWPLALLLIGGRPFHPYDAFWIAGGAAAAWAAWQRTS